MSQCDRILLLTLLMMHTDLNGGKNVNFERFLRCWDEAARWLKAAQDRT